MVEVLGGPGSPERGARAISNTLAVDHQDAGLAKVEVAADLDGLGRGRPGGGGHQEEA
jgi:hypothetical protein